MKKKELEELISLELSVRGSKENETFISNEYYEPSSKEQGETLNKYKINWFEKFLLESYTGYTFKYINKELRSSQPCAFTLKYKHYLSKLLNKIQSCDDQQIWRWHVIQEEFDLLAKSIGKSIQFPEFKSTSLKKKKEGLFLSIATSKRSNGKRIYKHIKESLGKVEKEILFLPDTTFMIESRCGCIIFLQEKEISMPDMIAKQHYYY